MAKSLYPFHALLFSPGPDSVCTATDVVVTSLEHLQKLVGGYVEAAPLPDDMPNFVMYVDEEGLLKGLPENLGASVLARQRLVGPAVLAWKV